MIAINPADHEPRPGGIGEARYSSGPRGGGEPSRAVRHRWVIRYNPVAPCPHHAREKIMNRRARTWDAAGAILSVAAILFPVLAGPAPAAQARPAGITSSPGKVEKELAEKHGDVQRPRIRRGLEQVAAFWREEDGDSKAFEEFARTGFAGDTGTLDMMFQRFSDNLEALDGHMNEIVLAFKAQADLDRGPVLRCSRLTRSSQATIRRPMRPTTSSGTSWPSWCFSISR
jgi:hypothetical protein